MKDRNLDPLAYGLKAEYYEVYYDKYTDTFYSREDLERKGMPVLQIQGKFHEVSMRKYYGVL